MNSKLIFIELDHVPVQQTTSDENGKGSGVSTAPFPCRLNVQHPGRIEEVKSNSTNDPRLVLSALKAAQIQAKQEGVALVQMITEATATQSNHGHIDFYA